MNIHIQKSFAIILTLLLLFTCSCSGASVGTETATDSSNIDTNINSDAENTETEIEEAASSVSDSEEQEISFTDALGRQVTLKPPKRVVAMIGSFADVWCLAGGKDTLVAAANNTWTSYDWDLPESVVDIGTVDAPNLELLLNARPDLILASSNMTSNMDLLDTFEQIGLTTAYFDIQEFDDYLHMLEIMTQLTGNKESYQKNGLEIQQQVENALARQDGSAPRIICLRINGNNCKTKGSTGTVLGEMLAGLGCVNLADRDTSMLDTLSMEAIMAGDPDYIFAVLQGSNTGGAEKMLESTLLSNPAWNGLRAVQNGNFHLMDHDLYNLKPNAKWGLAYEQLADILYPEPEE